MLPLLLKLCVPAYVTLALYTPAVANLRRRPHSSQPFQLSSQQAAHGASAALRAAREEQEAALLSETGLGAEQGACKALASLGRR